MIKERIIMNEKIYAHNINYWWNDNKGRELDECDIEHIQECLKEDYEQGELCQYDEKKDKTYYGWWTIQ